MPAGYVDEIEENGNVAEGSWRNETCANNIIPFPATQTRHVGRNAIEIRNALMNYFVTVGMSMETYVM